MQERSRVLFRFADLVEKHNDEIATLETWDNGKPFEQAAKTEVPMIVRFFRYYAGMFIFYNTTVTYAMWGLHKIYVLIWMFLRICG